MDLKSTYNKIAKDWTKDHSTDDWWITGTDKFTSYLNRGDSVLDVGCASGVKSEYLSKKGFVITGIDLSEEMIKLAEKRLPHNGFFFIRDIMEPLNLKVTFDGIFAQAVLLHVPKKNIKKVLTNLLNSLKPKGYIYIAVKKLKDGEAEEQFVKENDYGYEYERFFSFYTLDEIVGYLEDLNLKVIYTDTLPIGKTGWIQVIAQNNFN